MSSGVYALSGEERDGHSIACQAYKIVRCSVMAWNGLPVRIIICQPIRVDEVCLKEMQTICEKIHDSLQN